MRNLPNFYSNYSPGLPVLNGVPGSLVDLYKKILVQGTDPVSFTSIEVLAGVATVTGLVENQIFFNGSRISITGCDEPLLNDIHYVHEHGLLNFKFNTTAADGTYGGDIKISQPPAGWNLLFSGTNEAVFTSGNLDTIGVCIKIIDTNALYATVEVWENMTSLNAGVNKFNPLSFGADRVFRIYKSKNATSTAINYWLVADNTSVHFSNERIYNGSYQVPSLEGFRGGYITSFGQCSADNEAEDKNFYCCMKIAIASYSSDYYSSRTFMPGYSYATDNLVVTSGEVNGCILTKTFSLNSWKYFAVNSSLNIGNNRLSGSPTRLKQYNRLSNTTYVSDATAFMIENYSGLGFQIFGRIKEIVYFQQQVFKTIRNFELATINNKKYICLPLTANPYSGINATNYNPNSYGMIGILVAEEWS